MQLLNREYRRCQVRVPLIDHSIELYLEINTVLLLHVYNEVDTRDKHEGEEDAEDDVQVEVEDTRAAGREQQGFRVVKALRAAIARGGRTH